MKKIFIFLMAMPFIMALNSCDSDNTDGEEPDKEPDITWGEIQGDLNDIWYIAGDPQCVATSDN
ncbi:MAG: hypothetical protein LBS25_05185 [Candidatus Symbiothrix sp.]|jgi:hypothetical protein|nr:hypothetical protein [Candidatus Symbiothrix sp.]